MRQVVSGMTVARSRGQTNFHESMISYGAAVNTWNSTWVECAKVIENWVKKLNEKDIEGCPGCTLLNVENMFRNVLAAHTGYIVHGFLHGETNFEAPSPDQDIYDTLYEILDPESHEHGD